MQDADSQLVKLVLTFEMLIFRKTFFFYFKMSFKISFFFLKVFWALVSTPCALPKTCREDQSRAKSQEYTFQLSPELPRGNLTNLWRRQSHYLNTIAGMPSIFLEVGTTLFLKSKYFLLLLKYSNLKTCFWALTYPAYA